jgi:hypothetical protein
MAIDVRVGKSRLWAGAPLRVRVKVQPFQVAPSPKAILIGYKNAEVTKWNELKLPLDEKGEVVADISTSKVAPGAYEIAVWLSTNESFELPEPVWILSSEQFLDLAREEAGEEFRAAPGIQDVEQLKGFIEEIVRERLRAPLKTSESGGLISDTSYSAVGSFKGPISSAPIEWTTAAMINEINYLALGGAKTFRFHVELSGGIFGLRFEAVLNKALPGEVALLYRGKGISEFRLLNFRKDLRSFEERVDVTAFDPSVGLQIRHEAYGFPILGADATLDVRPKPRHNTARAAI